MSHPRGPQRRGGEGAHLRSGLRHESEHLLGREGDQVARQRGDRRADDERGADHAPQGPVLRRPGQVRAVARVFGGRGRVQSARVAVGAAEGNSNLRGVERAAGRHHDRPVRGHAAVAVGRGAGEHAHEARFGEAGGRDQCGPAAVSGGPEHARDTAQGVAQRTSKPALRLLELWPCAG